MYAVTHLLSSTGIERIIAQLDLEKIISQLNNPCSQSSTQSSGCPGAAFSWDLGSPHLSYPFAIHDPSSSSKPTFELISFNFRDATAHIRSSDCLGMYSNSSTMCSGCQAAGSMVNGIKFRAAKPPTNLNHSVLSYKQLLQKIGNIETILKKEKLAVCMSIFFIKCF